ncbi:hypothetical protein DM02DRAFT_502175, partial [Periconia macrospinosa]
GLEDVIRTVQSLSLRHFPHYKIGRGESVGEGETFWVEHCNVDGRAVAVKHLKVGFRQPGSPEFLRRVNSLLLELRIMHHGPLKSHPNILTLIGYGWNTEGGSILPYMLVEYCANGNLRQYLVDNKPVVPRCKELLIADVASGIHALHTAGIIHGDVKLDNVLVFDSNERRISPVAKICDFGHSVLVGILSRYNAPEVFNQKLKPIPRMELKKCDVWAFGLLAWEVLLDGAFYLNHVAGQTNMALDDSAQKNFEPGQVLLSAISSAQVGTDDIQRAIFRNLLKSTLEADPSLRVSELNSLPIMSKWRQVNKLHRITGTTGLSAQLALHTGASEWSYEIFRYEYNREIFWVHKKHIAQEFHTFFTTHTEEDAVKGSAAWQIALCYATGFGVSTDWNKADEHLIRAIELGNDVAQRFGPMLLRFGVENTGENYTNMIFAMNKIVPLDSLQCNEPPLIQGLRTRNRKTVEILLACGLSPQTKDKGGRNGFRWLFMLDEDALPFAEQCLMKFKHSEALNMPADGTLAIHPQWPLQLEGTPLAHAIATGSRGTVVALLHLGADPLAQAHVHKSHNILLQKHWTPIHVAVKYHRPDILTTLLDAARIKDTRNCSLILPALALCYSSVFERIAMHGRHLRKRLEEVIALLGPPSTLEEASTQGVTAFMHSIDSNDIQVTAALLQRNRTIAMKQSVSPSPAKSPIFHYPIHHAAQLASRRDEPEAVKILELIIKYDPCALSRLDSHGRTTLHMAASGSSSRAARFIVNRVPLLLHAKDERGAKPLHYCESTTVAEQLVELGAEVDASDDSGQSALCYAVLKGLGHVVKTLCKMRAATDMCAGYPLRLAIANKMHEIAASLIAFGACVNLQDNLGNTPLHSAAQRSPHRILRLLLDNDANASVPNNRG